MYTRTISLIGDNNFKKFKNINILIIGLGGVGGITLESLVRTGITNFTIIDYDTFDITNLNRQLISNYDYINKKKVYCAKEKMENINKDVNIKALDIFLDNSNIEVLKGHDYIIDCCDNIDTKLEIYKYCNENNIKLISSMGMGNRVDITKINISRLDRTLNDPLAKKLRFLCKKNNIDSKIKVVSSSELPFKSNIISSCFNVTNTAGIYLSDYIISDIIKS